MTLVKMRAVWSGAEASSIGERVGIHREVMQHKEEARSKLEMTLGNGKASYDLGFERARGFCLKELLEILRILALSRAHSPIV